MPVFKDADDVNAHIGQIFREALGDAELAPKFAESGVVLKIHYTEPACSMTADFPNSKVYFDDDSAPDGAGNPPNPSGLKTDYLWKEVLTPGGLTNILENYAQIVEEKNAKTGRKKHKQVFPRYTELCERIPVGAG